MLSAALRSAATALRVALRAFIVTTHMPRVSICCIASMGDSGHHNAREPVLGWESGSGLESRPALWALKEVT